MQIESTFNYKHLLLFSKEKNINLFEIPEDKRLQEKKRVAMFQALNVKLSQPYLYYNLKTST